MKINPIVKRVVQISFIILISGTLGGYIGFRQGVQISGITKDMVFFLESHVHMQNQFKEGTCQAVKLSLLEFDERADLYRNTNDYLYSSTKYYGDKVLTNGRLYLIDKKLDNLSSADEHMQSAIEACQKLGWSVCSEEKVLKFIERTDKNTPIVCLEE